MAKENTAVQTVDTKIDGLVSFNKKMGIVHLVQGALMMVFALFIYPSLSDTFDFTVNIVGNYLTFDAEVGGLVLTTTETLFALPFLPLTASFLLISGIFHFLIAGPWKDNYRAGLKEGINKYRWYEYALSSSLMIVLISVLFGTKSIVKTTFVSFKLFI